MSGPPRPKGRVRRAAPRDLDAIVALWRTLLADHAQLDSAFGIRSAAQRPLRDLLHRSLTESDSGIWVWASQAELGGFCVARIRRAPSLVAESARGEVDDLYVRPELRLQGIGGALVRAAFHWMQEAGAARVEVRVATGNQAGQAFWRALGFGEFVDVLHRRL